MKGPKNGVVKASFYVAPSLEEAKILNKQNCYLLVSVGQKYHEGEKLLASIELINKKFYSCTILVCDTLQRYNSEDYLAGLHDQAYAESLKAGDEWILRNYPLYSQLKIPYQIIRWDHWLQSPQFKLAQHRFEAEYKKNSGMRNAFRNSIDEFINRLKKRIDQDDNYFAERRQHCLSYLKEECAAMLLWAEAGIGYEIYPVKRNDAMAITYELLTKPSHPLQLRQLALRFKRYCSVPTTKRNSIAKACPISALEIAA